MHDINVIARDPRNKTGWSGTERFGPGPKSSTSSDQHRENLRYLGPDGIRTNKILKISNRIGPVGPGPWIPGNGGTKGELKIRSTSEPRKNCVFVCAIIFIEPEAINICFFREKNTIR